MLPSRRQNADWLAHLGRGGEAEARERQTDRRIEWGRERVWSTGWSTYWLGTHTYSHNVTQIVVVVSRLFLFDMIRLQRKSLRSTHVHRAKENRYTECKDLIEMNLIGHPRRMQPSEILMATRSSVEVTIGRYASLFRANNIK